ncbi:hypothetical protein [Legionella maioricensis]|uniref:FAD-binding PCMH-type domain-containing protein n=1 Tax=Legionella maioricensis TaxID=2896528 RepID=A0A9X2D2R4_9GAMM|nr:hypothetical protein [Legionella maioricensis]MCL9685173.1 hypothetical protein [Legionella maioricensis]MCL9688390.1 hypothetical protein [Legionella maioricensis]
MALTPKQQNKIVRLITDNNLDIDYSENTEWSNFCKTVNLSDVLVLKVYNLESAQAVIKKIYELNQQKNPEDRITCRVAAGGKDEEDYRSSELLETDNEKYNKSFSLTDLVSADIVINLVLANDVDAIQQVDATTVKIIPGPQIKAFDEILDRTFKLATQNPPSLINRVTPFGLAAVGGHGTDMRNGGYADNIKSITFLLMDGKLKKIDRTTNPEDFDTIVSAHLGLFGIVVEMELECKPAEKLECVQTAMSLPEFIDAVKTGKLPRKEYPMFSVYYAPTYEHDLTNTEIKNIKVMEYRSVPLNSEDRNIDVLARQMEQDLEVEIEEGLKVTDILALFPQLVPAYMKYVVTRFAIGRGQVISVGPAPDIYHYQVSYPWDINDFDCLFPVSDNFQEMIDSFIKVAKETQKAKDKGEAPVTFGAYARVFLNKDYPFSIAPGTHHNKKRFTCGFDVVSSPGAVGFEAFRDKMVHYFIRKFKAKLHWGKYVPLDKGIDYEEMYGDDLIKYRKVVKNWHIQNKLDIRRSPFLTEFPCKVLGLDEYIPAARFQKVQIFSMASSSSETIIDRVAALAKFMSWIEGQEIQDAHTQNLWRRVQDVHDKETNQAYYRTIERLEDYGEIGNRMIDMMSRLKEGQENYWNPYWMNSGTKLKNIIAEFEALPPTVLLDEVLNDKESNLYKAVNQPRISALTFLGAFGINRTKSVQMVEENTFADDSDDDIGYPY